MGLVIVDLDGKVCLQQAVSAKAVEVGKGKHGFVQPTFKDVSKAEKQFYRLKWWDTFWKGFTQQFITSVDDEVYVAMEDYPYRATDNAYQIGEASGIARLALVRTGFRLRLIDPGTLKIFITGKANPGVEHDEEGHVVETLSKTGKKLSNSELGKMAMKEAMQKNYCANFDPLTGDAEGDMYDALALAQFARLEYLVRKGELDLKNLSEGQRRVFLRTTPSFPTNILERPFLTWSAE